MHRDARPVEVVCCRPVFVAGTVCCRAFVRRRSDAATAHSPPRSGSQSASQSVSQPEGSMSTGRDWACRWLLEGRSAGEKAGRRGSRIVLFLSCFFVWALPCPALRASSKAPQRKSRAEVEPCRAPPVGRTRVAAKVRTDGLDWTTPGRHLLTAACERHFPTLHHAFTLAHLSCLALGNPRQCIGDIDFNRHRGGFYPVCREDLSTRLEGRMDHQLQNLWPPLWER